MRCQVTNLLYYFIEKTFCVHIAEFSITVNLLNRTVETICKNTLAPLTLCGIYRQMTLCPSHVKRDSETEPWWLNSAKIQVKSRRKYLAVLECNGGGGFKIIQKDRPYIIGLKKCEVSLPTQLCWTVTDKTGTSNKQLLTSGVKYCSNVPFCTYTGEHFSEDTHSCTQHPYFQTKNKKDNYGAFLLLQPEIHISQLAPLWLTGKH